MKERTGQRCLQPQEVRVRCLPPEKGSFRLRLCTEAPRLSANHCHVRMSIEVSKLTLQTLRVRDVIRVLASNVFAACTRQAEIERARETDRALIAHDAHARI